MLKLAAVPLTRENFQPYGEVIELDNARQFPINQGFTTRFHDLFTIDASAGEGHPIVSMFRSKPLPLPHRIESMERHPLGSQAFLPMDQDPFLVLVAGAGESVSAGDLTLFITNGQQGINFHRNTWHHFQIVLDRQRDFIVVDRDGPGINLEETTVHGEAYIDDLPLAVASH